MTRQEQMREAADRLPSVVAALDKEFPDWRELEFASQLDDWAPRSMLKRIGVTTLGELVDAFLAGHGFVALSMFRAVEVYFGPGSRLCNLVLSLFGKVPQLGATVVLADVQWTFREVPLPLVCPTCGADPREGGILVAGYDKVWQDGTASTHHVEISGEVLADGVVSFIPTVVICAGCCEPIIEGQDSRPDRGPSLPW